MPLQLKISEIRPFLKGYEDTTAYPHLAPIRIIASSDAEFATEAELRAIADYIWNALPETQGYSTYNLFNKLTGGCSLSANARFLISLKNMLGVNHIDPYELFTKVMSNLGDLEKVIQAIYMNGCNNPDLIKGYYKKIFSIITGDLDFIPITIEPAAAIIFADDEEFILKAMNWRRREEFFRRLTIVFAELTKNNLFNSDTLDIILNPQNPLAIHGLYSILTSTGDAFYLSPNLLTRLMSELTTEYTNAEVLINLMSQFSKVFEDKLSIKSNLSYILNNYKKIPPLVCHLLYDVPPHLCTRDLFRQLISISNQKSNEQQKIVLMREILARMLQENAENPNTINHAQSTHIDTVEKSIVDSVTKLKESYPDALAEKIFKAKIIELEKFANSLSSAKDEKYAKITISRILNRESPYRRENLSHRQMLVLAWIALHDETKYLSGVTLKTAKENFITKMVEIERAYNIDANDQDRGGQSQMACAGGTFNKTVEALNTIHRDVEIIFNTNRIANFRLQVITKKAVKAFLESHPDLSDDEKNKVISAIPALYSSIETAFKNDPDNAKFYNELVYLQMQTINAVNQPAVINAPAPDSVDVVDEPMIERVNFFVRAWQTVKRNVSAAFEKIKFNPFIQVAYNDENEPDSAAHPMLHTRTLHTSLTRKLRDSIRVLAGYDYYKCDPKDTFYFGLLDHLPGLNLLRIFHIFLLKSALYQRSRADEIALSIALLLITLLIKPLKFVVACVIIIVVFPVIALIHLASKIALRMEKTKSTKAIVSIIDPNITSTEKIEKRLKNANLSEILAENCIPAVASENTSIFVTPPKPTDTLREVIFSANKCKAYAVTQFSTRNPEHIKQARHIGRVNRKACLSLHQGNLLSSRMIGRA